MPAGCRSVQVSDAVWCCHLGLRYVVPMTTKPQRDDKFAVQLVSPLGERKAWVVCNHVHTVSTRRLSSPAGAVPRIQDDVFQAILRKVWRHLPLGAFTPILTDEPECTIMNADTGSLRGITASPQGETG